MRFLLVLFVLLWVPIAALAQVEVSDAWVRATVAGQSATGAFMKLVAASDTALVAVASPAAKSVEIHESRMEGTLMRMRAVERVVLPAGKPVELKPGGYHVMLMSLERPLAVDGVVPLTLTFEDAGGKRTRVEVQAKVRPLTHAPAKHAH